MVDITATGENIKRLMVENKVTYKDIQCALCFNTPQAIYKWMRGECLPSIDNMIVLADMFGCKIDDIVIVNK